MKKRLVVYLGLITLIGAFFAPSISALADVLEITKTSDVSSDIQKESTKQEIGESEVFSTSSSSELNKIVEPPTSTVGETVSSEKQQLKKQTTNSTTSDSDYAKLTLLVDPPRKDNKFFTGERIQFYQTIESSSEQLNDDVYSLIEISKAFVDKESIQVHADNSIKSYQILDENSDTWTIKIEYKAITSGGIVSVPISFNQRNYTTAPNSETIISSKLFFANKIIESDSLTVYAETVMPTMKKEVSPAQIKNGKVTIGLVSKNNNEISSDKKAELATIFYVLTATVGTTNGKGVYLDNAKMIEDQLPTEARLDEESHYSEGWDYNGTTHKISYVVPEEEEARTGKIEKILPVYFPSTKEATPILNKVDLKSSSGEVTAQASTSFIPNLDPRNQYLIGGSFKHVNGKQLDRYISEQPDDIAWTAYPYIRDNPFNREAYIKEIEDVIDETQEYSRMKISIPTDVIYDYMNLYGAKEDGNYQLIQEKIPADEDISVSKEYRKIKIVFNTPVSYSQEIKLNPVTKVKENIWAAGMDGKRVLNTVNVTYSNPEGKVLGSSSADGTAIYKAPRINFRTTIEDAKQVEGHINDVKTIKYYLAFPNVPEGEEAFVVTLLPSGVVPVTENENIKVITNYLNTGKVAILQKFINKEEQEMPLEVSVKLTGSLGKGEHKLQHYAYWKNKAILPGIMTVWGKPPYIIKNNPLDFDKLGTYVGREILGDDDLINYYPPLEVMVLKKIGTSPQTLSEMPIEVGETDDIYYEINLENRTNQAIENYNFYDILPFPGDKVSNQKNQGSNNSRGSTNSVVFSEIVSKDDDLDIYYSSDNNIDNLKLTTWHKLESDTPVNQIKSLKGVPKTQLAPNQKMSVVFKVKANEMKSSSVTKNAALLSQENQNVLVDSNTVEAQNIKPETTEVKGTKTWEDNENKDGNRPESITVNLLADGTLVDSKEVTEATGWDFEFKDLAKFKNNQEIIYTVTENSVEDYSTEIKSFDIINHYTPGKTSVTVTKQWDDNNNQDGIRAEDIELQLLANGKKQGEVVTLTAAGKWSHTWSELNQKANGRDIVYTVEEISVPGYEVTIDSTNKGNIILINKHRSEITSVEGIKTWLDNDNQDGKRPEKIMINLLANGKEVANKEVTEAENWSYEFKELAKYEKGTEVLYTITEDSVPEYTTEIHGYDVTNSYVPAPSSERIAITVIKEWDDNNNQDGKRPSSIHVQLLADGIKEGKVETLSAATNWRVTWDDLLKDVSGKEITYKIEEIETASYKTTVDYTNKNQIKLINSYKPETTSVKGKKTWLDQDNQDGKRPEKIKVNLLANGKEVANKEITEAENWSYEFKELAKYDAGQKITYSVTENSVTDYTTEIKGFDIINRYTPGKTSVTVTKEWDDKNNQDGKRPKTIQVQLLANGVKKGKVETLTAENNWSMMWQELDQKEKGQTIFYSVKEVEVPGYKVTVDDTDKGNIKLLNTRTPEKINIEGSKTWLDDNNEARKRPEKIVVNLLANGKKVSEKEVTEAENWSYEFKELAKYDAGQKITYSVTENNVTDYTTEIKGFDIINRYTPGKTSVTVTKEWDDENDQDNIRPSKIKVQLYGNGKKQGHSVEISKSDNWNYTWNGLDLVDDSGKKINYTIEELDIPKGYTASLSGDNIGNLVLINSHHLKIKEVPPTKITPNKPTAKVVDYLLPKTGEEGDYLLVLLGMTLLGVVYLMNYVRRKENENKLL